MEKTAQVAALEARCQFAQELGKKIEAMKAACRAEFHRQVGVLSGVKMVIPILATVEESKETGPAMANGYDSIKALLEQAQEQAHNQTGKEAQCEAILDVIESLFKASQESLALLVAASKNPPKAPVTAADTLPDKLAETPRPAAYIPHVRAAQEAQSDGGKPARTPKAKRKRKPKPKAKGTAKAKPSTGKATSGRHT